MSARPTSIDPAVLDADPRLREVRAHLRRVERRFRWREAAALMPVALGLGLGAMLVSAVVGRVSGTITAGTYLAAGAVLVLAALLSVCIYALVRPRDLLATARTADRLLGLDERLSTALEDAATPPAEPTGAVLKLRDAQLDDAVQSVSGKRLERELQVRVDGRRLAPAAVLLVAVLAVLFLPDFGQGVEEKATPAQVSTEQKNIEILKKAVEAQPRVAQDPTLQKLLQELNALSHDLKEGDLSKEEALARLSQTEAELQKALDPQVAAQREALDQLAKQLSAAGNENAREAGDALKNGDTQKAADALKKAGDDVSKMTLEERKALAESLRKARDSAAALDPELASRLNEAADALENADAGAAQQALKNVAEQVEQNGQKLATQQQVQQALAQIQQSKSNIAQVGQPTPGRGSGTAVANRTPGSGTPSGNGNGTPGSGTAVAGGTPFSGTPVVVGSVMSGTAVAAGSVTAVVISGTVVAGQASGTGTPVLVRGTPGQGTAVAIQGQGQGQGQGQSQSQGQGQGSAQSGSGQPSGAPSGGWGTGHQEQVYSPPSSVQADLTPVTLQGQDNPNGEQSSTTTNTDANNTGPSMVPYEQIFGQYKEQAGNALDSDYIPQGYKDLVKDYFSDIAP